MFIRATVFKIANYLSTAKIESFQARSINKYVTQLLKRGMTEQVLAELGLLYFYLDRSGSLPYQTNFEKYRLDEIHEEIITLQQSETSRLPSGVITYLLRVFCTMSIDSNGKVNMGGVFAVERFLLNALSQYFSEDHIQHISIILKHIKSDSDFVLALEHQVSCISSSMEAFIRIDLKIPFHVKVTSHHAQMACLFALFYDLRQFHQPNCYAIATVIYGIEKSPLKVLNKIKELLENGFITVDSKIRIPISFLFNYRLMDGQSTSIYLDVKNITNAATLHAACRAIGIDLSLRSDSEQKRVWSVKEILEQASSYTANPQDSFSVASSTFGSFKKNALLEMLVSTLEFVEINSPSSSNCIKSLLQLIKQEIVDSVVNGLYSYVEKSENKEFLDVFEKMILEMLWTQNAAGKLNQVNGTWEVVLLQDAIALPNFSGNSAALQYALSNHQRILCMRENQIAIIDTFTGLIKILQAIVDHILASRTDANLFSDQPFVLHLKTFFSSVAFREKIAHFLLEFNQDVFPLTLQNYYDSGLFIFRQVGADTLDTPLTTLDIPFQSKEFDFRTANQNFFQLFEHLFSMPDKEKFRSPSHPILCMSNNHAFILRPYKFYPIIEFGPKMVLKALSIEPLLHLLKNTLMPEQMKSVLLKTYHDNSLATSLFLQAPHNTTVEQFMEFGFRYVDPVLLTSFMNALENEITLISCDGGHMNWRAFLTKLPDPPSNDILDRIVTQLESHFKIDSRKTPYQAACHLQNTLAVYGMFYSNIRLENFLRLQHSLPMAWVIGDLNYGNFVEAPDHEELVIKIVPQYASSAILARLVYFTRKGGQEKLLAPELWQGIEKGLRIAYS